MFVSPLCINATQKSLIKNVDFYRLRHTNLITLFNAYVIITHFCKCHPHGFLNFMIGLFYAMLNPNLSHRSFPVRQSCAFNLDACELDPDSLCMHNNDTSVTDSSLFFHFLSFLLEATGLRTWCVSSWTSLLITVGRSGPRHRGSLATSLA